MWVLRYFRVRLVRDSSNWQAVRYLVPRVACLEVETAFLEYLPVEPFLLDEDLCVPRRTVSAEDGR